jgi:hypothetical protein
LYRNNELWFWAEKAETPEKIQSGQS